jgi:DMSO/TMAO reductase YedYZ molybdopterin-dependent catalytic subunit
MTLLDGRVLAAGDIYMRNNFSIPRSPATEVAVRTGERAFSLNLDELNRLPRVDVTIVLECAGNGRALMDPAPEGIPWKLGAISTVRFGGTPLLEAVGPIPDSASELVFTGSDRGVVEPEGEINYQFSLTRDLWDRAILATRLGDDHLPIDHGGPVRLVVPGQYAMKSVKWLRAIDAVELPFTGHFVEKYRYFGDVDFPEGAPVSDLRVRSLIASPADGSTLPAGSVTVKGMAWAATSDLQAVEVSQDDGETWSAATTMPAGSQFAPVTWETELALDPGVYVIAARATDESGDVQTDEPRWNRNGYGNNMIHRVRLTVT